MAERNPFNTFTNELKYNPEYKPDTSAILSGLGLKVMDSDIIVDGGNVISCGNKVIMTDKIFRENPHYDHNGLISISCTLASTFLFQ